MKVIPLILSVCLLLTACSGFGSAPTTAAPTTVPTTAAPTTEPATEPTTVPTTVPPTTEDPTPYTNPLTGLPSAQPHVERPVAVVTNNINAALPHHGTSQADVVYEILAEGGITRCLAVYSDVKAVGEIGSIRSARTYFISLAKNYEAILVHSGDSIHANDLFRTGRYPHVDGGGAQPFYRNQKRLDAGYSLEHTMFTTGDALHAFLSEHFTMDARRQEYGFVFDENAVPTGESAQSVTVTFAVGGKTTRFDYDSEKNAYSVFQHKRDYVDGNTEQKVYFTNVIVMYAKMRTTETTHVFHTLEGSNDGYYISGGKMIPIRWERANENEPFRYVLEDGTPLTMTPGTSYIAIVPPRSTVAAQ